MERIVPDPSDALAAWAAMVRANREQAERLREGEDRGDFYAPVASAFRADPRRNDEEALDRLAELVRPGETWLDIGAGGGRYALPLALRGARVIAVEPSPGMLAVLRDGMSEHGIRGIEIVESRWPMANPPIADVAFISHVGYDIEEIGPFLDGMEAAARRLCVALLLNEAPAARAWEAWPPIHGEERAPLPALPEFVTLLLARGRFVEVRAAGVRSPGFYTDVESAAGFLRQQLFIEAGGEKDRRLVAHLEAAMTPDGIPAGASPVPLAVVTWAPGRA